MRALKYDRKMMNGRYIELFHELPSRDSRRTGPHSPPPSPPPLLSQRHDERIDSKPTFSSAYQPPNPYFSAPAPTKSQFSASKAPQSFSTSYNSPSSRFSSRPTSHQPPPRPQSPPKPPVKPVSQNYSSQFQPKFNFNTNTNTQNDFSNLQNNYTPFGPLNRAAPVTPSVTPTQSSKPTLPYLAPNPYTSFSSSNPPSLPQSTAKSFYNRGGGAYQSNMNQSKFSY